ncbi:hypothetical protein ACS72_00355 [Acinetobacter sp. VT 511]|nr:hypothetical protein ACS72_00355 [Acinetobacter sp. VT 511]
MENKRENQTAIEIPTQDETRFVLTWGKDPVDLDSHLVGPAGDEGMFHTYYSDKQYYNNGELMVDLDLDDVTSYGPETTTIRHLLPGTYTFYVHHFSGCFGWRGLSRSVDVDATAEDAEFTQKTLKVLCRGTSRSRSGHSRIARPAQNA